MTIILKIIKTSNPGCMRLETGKICLWQIWQNSDESGCGLTVLTFAFWGKEWTSIILSWTVCLPDETRKRKPRINVCSAIATSILSLRKYHHYYAIIIAFPDMSKNSYRPSKWKGIYHKCQILTSEDLLQPSRTVKWLPMCAMLGLLIDFNDLSTQFVRTAQKCVQTSQLWQSTC